LVIDETLQCISSTNCYLGDKNPLARAMFQYFNCISLVEAGLEQHAPLVINYHFEDIDIKYGAYLQLYSIYINILNCSRGVRIT
jgi:hypothetical protein